MRAWDHGRIDWNPAKWPGHMTLHTGDYLALLDSDHIGQSSRHTGSVWKKGHTLEVRAQPHGGAGGKGGELKVSNYNYYNSLC